MVTQIATAANEQTSTAEQINSNVEQIAKLVHESAGGAQQSAKACEDLSHLAFDLQQLVNRFRLAESSGGVRTGLAGKVPGQSYGRTMRSSPLQTVTNEECPWRGAGIRAAGQHRDALNGEEQAPPTSETPAITLAARNGVLGLLACRVG